VLGEDPERATVLAGICYDRSYQICPYIRVSWVRPRGGVWDAYRMNRCRGRSQLVMSRRCRNSRRPHGPCWWRRDGHVVRSRMVSMLEMWGMWDFDFAVSRRPLKTVEIFCWRWPNSSHRFFAMPPELAPSLLSGSGTSRSRFWPRWGWHAEISRFHQSSPGLARGCFTNLAGQNATTFWTTKWLIFSSPDASQVMCGLSNTHCTCAWNFFPN
jgi:hypothetical protein